MTTRRHLSLSVRGALNDPEKLVGCITVDGMTLNTIQQVASFLRGELADGHEVLPMSDECEGFDYKTGCPGHKVKESDSDE